MRGILLALSLGIVGCADTQFARTARSIVGKEITIPKGAEPNLGAASRVDQIGRQIAAANPFIGIEPTFQTIGSPESLLFHLDQHGMIISDSLVSSCKTDAQLAAVLCSELGKMVSEHRNAIRMGYPDPLPNISVPNSSEMNGIPADQFRLAELAMLEKRFPKKEADRMRSLTIDPQKIATDLLKTTGFEESAMSSVEPLLKSANKDSAISRQLGGKGTKPTWSN